MPNPPVGLKTTLHSNMFLLIQSGILKCTSAQLNFTFQYVSINTAVCQLPFFSRKTLHSNMFLLIPNAARYASQLGFAFTFQYVSINTSSCVN